MAHSFIQFFQAYFAFKWPNNYLDMTRDKKLENIRALFYRDFSFDNWTNRIKSLLSTESSVLEIGAGSGKGHQNFIDYRSLCDFSLGIDLDPRVLDNPNFHENSNISAYELDQYKDRKFDLILSNMVAEHIDDPDEFIKQQLALMHSNSQSIHQTVSKYYYSSLANYVVSDRVKFWLIEKLGSGRASKDVFPAHYLLNTKKDLLKLANKHGCEIEVERYRAPPGYLRRSYILMLIYVLIDFPLSFLIPAIQPGIIFTIRKID